MNQGRVLHDFDAQPNSSEISVRSGEIVTITRQDLGDGWWEGINAMGQQGLFPEAYIEVLSAVPPPSMPPPDLPPPPLPSNDWDEPAPTKQDSFDNTSIRTVPQQQPLYPNVTATSKVTDDDVYGWDDSDEEASTGTGNTQSARPSQQASGSGNLYARSSVKPSGSFNDLNRQGTVGRNFNRFTKFVSTGTEAYILGTNVPSMEPAENFEITFDSTGVPVWTNSGSPYTCVVDKPKKESKMKGLKSFIAYQLTPSFTGIQVSRRYKHFDWLMERLQSKFVLTPIPPLPEKQVSGKFEEELIEHRKQILQLWVAKISRHPLLSQSQLWQHYLTCTDEKEWKKGKRRAEKDEYVGGNFFFLVKTPSRQLPYQEVESRVEQFLRMGKALDESVRQVQERSAALAKEMTCTYRKDYQKLGLAYDNLANSFLLDDNPENSVFTEAIRQTASCYSTIGDLYEQQPKMDAEPLLDALYAYKGMLASIPDIVNVHKSAMEKLKQQKHLANTAETETIQRKVDTISYVMLAEISHFHNERRVDFKHNMAQMLKSQIAFQQKITGELQNALAAVEKA